MSINELNITGMSAVTSVGLTATQTCASIRAGISGFTEHPYHFSLIEKPFLNDPQPLVCSPIPVIDPSTLIPDRLLNLALSSCEEAFTSALIQRNDLNDFGLFLALPPVIEGIPEWGIDAYLPNEFYRRAGIKPFPITRTYRQGRTGFFHAMTDATKALDEKQCRFALIGGIDSYLGEESISYFDQSYRLKSERNLDGFIPGEASVFVIAESAESAKQRNVIICGIVEAISFGMEDQNFMGDRVSSGCGLTEVFRRVYSKTKVQPRWVACDLNGESYRSAEWGLVITRNNALLSNVKEVSHSADCVGDIRAAGPALSVLTVCKAFAKGYAPANSCVVYGSDEKGDRAACLVKS